MDSLKPGQPWQSANLCVSHPPFLPTGLSLALLAALSLIPVQPAAASGASGTIDTAITTPCVLGHHENLVITDEGGIDVTSGAAITVEHATAGTNRVYNSGTLSGDQGLVIEDTRATGTLQNTTTGEIEGANGSTVRLTDSTFTGNISNDGRITAPRNGYALEVQRTTLKGSITNTGTLDGGVLVVDSRVTGDIANSKAGTVDLYLASSTLDGSVRNTGNTTGDTVGLQLNNSLVKQSPAWTGGSNTPSAPKVPA